MPSPNKFQNLRIGLETLRLACLTHPVLTGDFLVAFEESFGKLYHGHIVLDLGVVSIFLTDPRSCTTRCTRTIKLHEKWNDYSVAAALLDRDVDGVPLTLDIFPKKAP